MTFTATINSHQQITNELETPVIARYVRFNILRWYATEILQPTMQVDVLGCGYVDDGMYVFY